jgi:hypothetical protein
MFKNKFTLKIINKVIIGLVMVSITMGTVYFFIQQIKKINTSITEKKKMDYFISHREQINNKIKADLANTNPAYQDKISESIPPVYDILPLVDSLENLSKKYSFKQTINFNQPVPSLEIGGPIPLMLINFNLTLDDAGISNFTDYLKDFEKLPYFISINSISYLGNNSNGWQDSSSINISGSLYAHQ